MLCVVWFVLFEFCVVVVLVWFVGLVVCSGVCVCVVCCVCFVILFFGCVHFLICCFIGLYCGLLFCRFRMFLCVRLYVGVFVLFVFCWLLLFY